MVMGELRGIRYIYIKSIKGRKTEKSDYKTASNYPVKVRVEISREER